jgi:hypothetical protein
MRGLVRAVILSSAIAAAVSFPPSVSASSRNGVARYIGKHDIGCTSCSAMSRAQFRDALARLRKTPDLRADVFVGGAPDYSPVALPLRAVEDGAKCTAADGKTVAKLVTLMGALKYSAGVLTSVRPVVEIRFHRGGDAPERPVLEAFFDWGFSGGPFKEGAVQTAIIDGRLAMVDYKHLSALEDFAAALTVPPGNKACEASRTK